MGKRLIMVVTIIVGIAISAVSQNIHYELSMPAPETHYFEVKMMLDDVNKEVLDVTMPVWTPGSYLVREFPKNVEEVRVVNEDNGQLPVDKIDKNTWRIQANGSEQVVLTYKVYAFEMSVRTSFLDADHGYLNGTSIFMYLEGAMEVPSEVKIIPYKEWEVVSTALPKKNGEKWVYEAENYDQLADCPIEIGNHDVYEFKAAGVDHKIAMYGEGNFDIKKLKKDISNIAEGLTDLYGKNPIDDYLFIIHNLENGSGGLEHMNSTTLQVNRWVYEPENDYLRFLNLVIHEYFHLWLVKRIRPESLVEYDYDKENYTKLLWVMEGFTTYYAHLMLARLGYIDETRFLNRMSGYYSRLENKPGNRVQPVSMASFDAWIKYYRQNENSYNNMISYYSKGAVLASLLDIMVIHHSEGKNDLGDVLQYLYKNHYKKEWTGISDEDMKTALEQYTGRNLDDFYEKYVNGTEKIDYQQYYKLVGLKIQEKKRENGQYRLGVSVAERGGKLTVTRVTRNTPAYEGGLNVNDEIIAMDGYRVNKGKISTVLQNNRAGDKIDVLIARDGKLKQLQVKVEVEHEMYYEVSMGNNASGKHKKLLSRWLSGK